MQRVYPLTVGPILGAVSDRRARIFGRGDSQDPRSRSLLLKRWWYRLTDRSKGKGRVCIGVARLRRSGDRAAWGAPVFSWMRPYFDCTSVAVFSELRPETTYEYQMGWFYGDRLPADSGAASFPLNWSSIEPIAFTTGSADREQPRSFFVGSCRYLLKLWHAKIWDDRGDKTFRSMGNLLRRGDSTNALFMLGDQIYADDLGSVRPDRQIEQFFHRYRDAFSQPHIRWLMARVPTYMTLDDHEIEDNWPEKSTSRDRVRLYPVAIHSYLTYQLSHSPLFDVADNGQHIAGTPTKLWYSYRDGCCDYFVMDTRTERMLEPLAYRTIVGPDQFDALKYWLADGSDAVKFIASAVPFFPDGSPPSDDKWSGFLKQRDELLHWIRDHAIHRVVFLSGDVHCSFSAVLTHDRDAAFQIISIVSSSFFWPYPDRLKTQFQESGLLLTAGREPYRIAQTTPIIREDNFTRVTASLETIDVEIFARKGQSLSRQTFSF